MRYKCNPENDEHTEECIKSNSPVCIELLEIISCPICGRDPIVCFHGFKVKEE
jgi:hypothetical protein